MLHVGSLACFEVLLVEAQAQELGAGDPAAALAVILDALQRVPDETRRAEGRLRAVQLAVKAGCSHTYIFSTGRFSQRIFHNLGYSIMHEIKYADYEKDKRGRPFLDNHGDHTVLQVVALQHEAASN